MPRMPSPRYFKSRQAFYCQYQGQQYPLAKGPDDRPDGPTFLAALEEFGRIMREGAAANTKDGMNVKLLCNLFMERTEREVTQGNQTRRLTRLRPFVEAYGDRPVRDLTPHDVNRFLETMRRPRVIVVRKKGRRVVSWNDSTCSDFIRTIHAAINWALSADLLTKNPLKGLKRRRVRSRGAESIITPEQHALVLERCRSKDMRELLSALEHTGARPGELLAATAADWHDAEGYFIFLADDRRGQGRFRHKTAGNKDRVIYFTGEVLEMVRRRVREHPKGPVFCNKKGGAYYPDSVIHHFNKLRKKHPDMRHISPYSYRHTFATNWLLAGKSIEILAELLGNTPETIRLHYAHLCKDRDAIRRQLEAFKGSSGTSAAAPDGAASGAGRVMLGWAERSGSPGGRLPGHPR